LLPLSLTFFLLSPLAGRLLIRTGPGILIATGMSLTGTGIFALAGISSQSSDATMLAGLLAIGAGLGLITSPIMTVAVSNVPSERSGTSSGLVNVGRMVGATVGVAILGSIFGAHVDAAGQDAAAFLMGMRRALAVAGSAEFGGALIALRFLMGRDSRNPRDPNRGGACHSLIVVEKLLLRHRIDRGLRRSR